MSDFISEQQINSFLASRWKERLGSASCKQATDTPEITDIPDEQILLSSDIDVPPSGSIQRDVLVHQTAKDMEANRELREKYALKAYRLAVGCIIMWAVLLVIQGFFQLFLDKSLWSDKVIIAVTTGVTVSVLAAFLGVIRGLFPRLDK